MTTRDELLNPKSRAQSDIGGDDISVDAGRLPAHEDDGPPVPYQTLQLFILTGRLNNNILSTKRERNAAR